MIKLLLLIQILLLSISCIQNNPETGKAISSSIIGGEEANEQFPSIVALVHPEIGSFCSGTVISPTIILTASHCIEGIGSKFSDAKVFYGSKVPKVLTKENSYFIKAAHIHPRRPLLADLNRERYLEYDLAVLYLKRAIPIAKEDIPEIATHEDIDENDKIFAVGFGLARKINNLPWPLSNIGKMGIKRFKETEILSIDERSMIKVEYSILPGDSGSGLLALSEEGKLKVIGTASYIDAKENSFYYSKKAKGNFTSHQSLRNWLSSRYFMDHAEVAQKIKNTAYAYFYYDAAIKAYPQNNRAIMKKAQMSVTLEDHYPEAIEALDGLIKDDPTNFLFRLMLSLVHMDTENWESFEKNTYDNYALLRDSYKDNFENYATYIDTFLQTTYPEEDPRLIKAMEIMQPIKKEFTAN